MPPTTMIGHGDGWTLFDNLYMFNGTLLVVSDEDRDTFPETRMMTSTGLAAENTPENIQAREPTTADMDFWTRREANVYFGNRIYPVSSLTLLYNDPPQFIDHYYHFAAELFLGTWRFLSGHLDKTIPRSGETALADPARAIFAHCGGATWRDKIGYNQYFLHATWPSIGLETAEDWAGRIRMTQGSSGSAEENGADGTARAWRFDRVLLVDRSAAFRGPTTGYYTHRTAGSAFLSTLGKASPYWWETVRRRVLSFSGVSNRTLDYATGLDPAAPIKLSSDSEKQPIVISYVSRQGWRRRLIEEDHELLEKSVKELCERKGWEYLLFHPEKYTLDEQLKIAARSTVMFGVHGNGLTHLIAMPASPISTVIEIFYPDGFARDYQWTAESLGHKHFGVWNDTYFTSPDLPSVQYPEGFQGTQIPVYGPAVAKLIEDRVEGRLSDKPLPCADKYCSFTGSDL
ncbi:hypothetical protein DL93DRAFT_2056393 [Clavulina sp. PMI_390]|nr:hypothetical protein DL93DRAFT_2056393 [Clavulina sp. PMI_390]